MSERESPTEFLRPKEVLVAIADERIVMIEYPFPVLDGAAVALLRLPKRLTRADVDRLLAMIQTLPVEDTE